VKLPSSLFGLIDSPPKTFIWQLFTFYLSRFFDYDHAFEYISFNTLMLVELSVLRKHLVAKKNSLSRHSSSSLHRQPQHQNIVVMLYS
jgi:hypothetical protein